MKEIDFQMKTVLQFLKFKKLPFKSLFVFFFHVFSCFSSITIWPIVKTDFPQGELEGKQLLDCKKKKGERKGNL